MRRSLVGLVLVCLCLVMAFVPASVSGRAAPPVGPGPTAAPTIEFGPLRASSSGPVSRRTGYIPSPMDLSHLKGDRMPAGASAAALPSRLDWREAGIVTPVRDQGQCGACYAFSFVAAFESKILRDGSGNVSTLNLSENQAKECNWEEVNNFASGSLGGCEGGNPQMIANLFSLKGAAQESCDPYVPADVACGTSCVPHKTLLGWSQISGNAMADTNVLKAYIQAYGPVHTSLYVGDGDAWDSEFNAYNGSYTLYHPGAEEPNHAVLIVGWDDGLTHAGGSGAWIVKNSWGSGWGNGGYFTIAYGSASIGTDSGLVFAWQDYDPNGGLLYYDDAGWNSWIGWPSSLTGWGLVKFVPAVATQVTRVEFWTTDATSDVDVYLYDSFEGNAPSGLLRAQENLSFPEAGYHSVAVPALPVAAGNDIVVVIKFTNASFVYPLALDGRGPAETGRCFLSSNGTTGSWSDLRAAGAYDLAIRLRTSNIQPTITPTATTIPTATRSPTPSPTRSATPTATRTVVLSPTVTRTPTPSRTIGPTTPGSRLYLPVLMRRYGTSSPGGAGIHGRVTYGGAPAAGIQLRLIAYNESASSSVQATTTGGDGRYLFTSVPALPAGQRYYVLFGPNTADSRYLYAWYGPDITSYVAGTSAAGGDFDIANLALTSPAHGSVLPLPVTFTWQRRSVAADTYRWVLFDLEDSDLSWITNDLGYAEQFTLTGLPEGAQLGRSYGWYVEVHNGPGNFGSSYFYRGITFSAGGAGSPDGVLSGRGGVERSRHQRATGNVGK